MKIRTFEFTPDATGRADFRLAYDTLRGRDPSKCTGQERQWVAQMQRALDSVSEPIGELPENAEIDGRNRKLQEQGGTIEITQKLHEKFNDWIEEAPFSPICAVIAEDFRDRWGQAEKGERDDVPGKAKTGPRALEQVG